MLEKFTPEEIEQIKKELGMLAEPNSKCVVIGDEHAKLSSVIHLMHEKYDDKKFDVIRSDLDKSLYMLTDAITSNYTDFTHRFKNRGWCRNSVVKHEIQDVYKEVYSKLIDVCLEYMEDCHEL